MAGYYVAPTVIEATADMSISQQEVFGPVLVIMPFEDEQQAVKMTLSAVFIASTPSSQQQIKTGITEENTHTKITLDVKEKRYPDLTISRQSQTYQDDGTVLVC